MTRVLILGAYGLIGAACLRKLRNDGFEITGMGRSTAAARAVAPDVSWILRDLTAVSVDEWRAILADADVVVNAAGALQDGARDSVEAIHVGMIDRLTRALGYVDRNLRLVQISAAGAHDGASSAFMRTKARGDALIVERLKDWVILRPTLVLSCDAYGGTALLRGAAALPGTVPQIYPNSVIQTVHVEDVAHAVCACVAGDIAAGTIADVTETGQQTLPQLTERLRSWLGLPPARWRLRLSGWVLRATGRGADLMGYLGWRPALRSTALLALQDGVTGDPEPWARAGGVPCRSLEDTLRDLPATAQERLFARLYFAIPLAIATLALFWAASGLITLADPGTAIHVLTSRGMGTAASTVFVWGGAIADIALGFAIVWRPWARAAALGMIALSLAYLLGSVLVAPDLWSHPLGPMVKVLPGIVLATLVALSLEAR